jgi:hypothetical protein
MRYWDTWLSDENDESPIMDGGPMANVVDGENNGEKSSGFDDVPLFDPPVDRIGSGQLGSDVCRPGGQMHD